MTDTLLVLNSGSSSLKFAAFALADDGLSLGFALDPVRNAANAPDISAGGGTTRVLVRHTDEEWTVALHMMQLLAIRAKG